MDACRSGSALTSCQATLVLLKRSVNDEPERNQDAIAQGKRKEAMKYVVICDVNDAVNETQRHVAPRQRQKQDRTGLGSVRDDTYYIKQ